MFLQYPISRLSILLLSVFLVLLGGIAKEALAFQDIRADEDLLVDPADESKADWGELRKQFVTIASNLFHGDNEYFGTSPLRQVERRLKMAGIRPGQEFQLRSNYSFQLLKFGKTAEAVEQVELLTQLIKKMGVKKTPPQLLRLKSIVYLRHAEVENCIRRHNADCCIFPLQNGAVHVNRRPAENAKSALLELLDSEPDDVGSIWLLNITAMALGEYPNGVPEKYLIPKSRFDSQYEIGRFVDIGKKLGVDTFNLCGGVITEDFDGDGFIDIVTSSSDMSEPLHFYKNSGDGSFSDVSNSSKLSDQTGGLNLFATDFNNDGDIDFLIMRGAWLFERGRIRNSLMKNNGDGTFTDVTKQAGLALPAYPSQAAVWADFDNDGDLDVFIGNERKKKSDSYPSQLFMNNGDGTFEDVAKEAGVQNNRMCKGVTAGDFDNDGDMDLYVSNFGPNRMYRNEGNGRFTDVAVKLGLVQPANRSFATWFFDYDNDGHLDLFVTAYGTRIKDLALEALGKVSESEPPKLYRNKGDGTFEDVTTKVGLNRAFQPMGANFGDLDNDGFFDIYLTTGDPQFRSLMPNVMMRNNAGKGFQDVTSSGGFGHLQKGHGVAFVDIDNDGDQDIYNQLGGFYPGDKFSNALYQNPGHNNQFIKVKLVGTKSNRLGIGARIKVVTKSESGSQQFYRFAGSVSSFGGSTIRQEIGIGKATEIERIEVNWPVSMTTQVFEDVKPGTFVEITEGQDALKSLDHAAVKFN